MNLMECLKKQSEDNKPILYLGKHYEKVILPLKEYQKMCNRLESIDNANPSEALECLDKLKGMEISSMPFSDEYGTQEVDLNDIRKVGSQLNTDFREYTATIKQALLKAQEQEAKFLDNLQRWFLLLGESGANTKYKVRDEMEAVIDELKGVLE